MLLFYLFKMFLTRHLVLKILFYPCLIILTIFYGFMMLKCSVFHTYFYAFPLLAGFMCIALLIDCLCWLPISERNQPVASNADVDQCKENFVWRSAFRLFSNKVLQTSMRFLQLLKSCGFDQVTVLNEIIVGISNNWIPISLYDVL